MRRIGDYRAVLTEVTNYQRVRAGEETNDQESGAHRWFSKAAKVNLIIACRIIAPVLK